MANLTINDLASVNANDFAATFINNIKTIAAFDKQAILTQVLQIQEENTVKNLRSLLLQDLVRILPEYQCRTPKNRTATNEINKDIVQFMVSIVEHTRSEQLENAFKSPNELTETMAKLIGLTTTMHQELRTLKATVETQQQTICKLKADLAKQSSDNTRASGRYSCNRIDYSGGRNRDDHVYATNYHNPRGGYDKKRYSRSTKSESAVLQPRK